MFYWLEKMVVLCFHQLDISWLNRLWPLVRTRPSFPSSVFLNPSPFSTTHPIQYKRMDVIHIHTLHTAVLHCTLCPYCSRGTAFQNPQCQYSYILQWWVVCSNKCWLGNKAHWQITPSLLLGSSVLLAYLKSFQVSDASLNIRKIHTCFMCLLHKTDHCLPLFSWCCHISRSLCFKASGIAQS